MFDHLEPSSDSLSLSLRFSFSPPEIYIRASGKRQKKKSWTPGAGERETAEGASGALRSESGAECRARVRQYLRGETPRCPPRLRVRSCCCWASLCTSRGPWFAPVETPHTHTHLMMLFYADLRAHAHIRTDSHKQFPYARKRRPAHLEGHLVFGHVAQDDEALFLHVSGTEAELLRRAAGKKNNNHDDRKKNTSCQTGAASQTRVWVVRKRPGFLKITLTYDSSTAAAIDYFCNRFFPPE